MRSELIHNRARASQLLAFDGMQYGRCRPTDIDVAMDWQGKFFVFVELKSKGKGLSVGQRLHLTALVDAIVAGGRQAVAILAEHDTPDTETDVHVAQSTVVKMYDGVQWVDEGEIKLDTLLHVLHNEYIRSKTGTAESAQ
jgi:hypothetical protein